MEVVIDIQCCKMNNEFIFKEIAIIDVNDEYALPAVFLLKPPVPWKNLSTQNKRENMWLQREYHGLRWDSGSVPYNDHKKIFKDLEKMVGEEQLTVYVKGAQKAQWLEPFFKKIHNLEDLRCPSFEKLLSRRKSCCMYHPRFWRKNCAMQNAFALKNWIKGNSVLVDLTRDEIHDCLSKVEGNLIFLNHSHEEIRRILEIIERDENYDADDDDDDEILITSEDLEKLLQNHLFDDSSIDMTSSTDEDINDDDDEMAGPSKRQRTSSQEGVDEVD